MKRPLFALVACSLAACVHSGPAPSAVKAAPRPEGCATASLVVLRNVATASAVDPVETERAILLSESFRASVARTSPSVDLRAAMNVQRVGRSAVLVVRTTAAHRAEALAVCNAVLDAAFLFGKEGLDFLEEQARALEAELDPKEKALREFYEKNDLHVLPLADRLAIVQARIRELSLALRPSRGAAALSPAESAALQAALQESRDEALRLDAVKLEALRLERELETVRMRYDLVRKKLAEEALAKVLEQDLRVLDRCAPCE
ncbi:MAG: hypothetical protein ACOX6T_01605 [Myxococcales bacterium]|jgi:hypothetical protein